jgi:hypothetical protein
MHGLSTQVHNQMNVEEYYRIVYEKCAGKVGGLIVDVFSGGPRDTKKIYELLNGNGKFIAIDSDPQRIQDMRNTENFVVVENQHDVEIAFKEAKVAIIRGSFPEQPYGTTDIDLDGQVDFILCNAGIMFVRPDQLEDTLKQLALMLAPQGELVLRFSQERNDQAKNLGITYFVHDPEKVQAVLRRTGMLVERHKDLPDPAGRPFFWTDIHVFKLPRLSR